MGLPGAGNQNSASNGASTQSLGVYSDFLEKLTNSIRRELDSPILDVARKPYIFKVHEKFRKVDRTAYTPELVSIGPYHRGNKTLKSMEDHKLRYAKSFLSRNRIDLKDFVECMAQLEDHAREYYSESTYQLSSDEFVKMMLLDGLFIIVLFEKYAGEAEREEDPIFASSWTISSLIRDLFLLENQIPMFVLHALFEKNMSSMSSYSKFNMPSHSMFNRLALGFFANLFTPMRYPEVCESYNYENESKHLLELLGATAFRPSPPYSRSRTTITSTFLPSATELHRAGVKFKKATLECNVLDISFNNGVLRIPPICIQDQTEVLLRNLITYQQFSYGNTIHTISYVFFMDNLIQSLEDVKLLCDAGIITNYLGNDNDIVKIFSNLLLEVAIGNNIYSDIYLKVDKFCNSTYHHWREILDRRYFQSPWAVISLVGAFILLVLTTIQTIAAIVQLNPPK